MIKKATLALIFSLILFSIPVKAETYSVPENTGFKTYMDYRAITNKKSPQYKMVLATVNGDYGIRMYDNRYSVAVGTAFNARVGTKIDIYLDSGKVLNCIVGDIKADAHTDVTHTQGGHGDVVEFIVDSKVMNKDAKRMGDCSVLPGFAGKVIKVEVLEWDG